MKTLKKIYAVLTIVALTFAIGSVYGHQTDAAVFSILALGAFAVRTGMRYESNLAMTGIIDATDLTFNGKEAMAISEAIYEKVFTKPRLRDLHAIRTGIKAKQQIPFLGKLGLVGKKKADCDTTANASHISMSEKFWNPEYISDRFTECWATLKPSFFVWGLKNGIAKEDLTDTDFANFLEERISDAVMEMLIRVAHFGDTTEDVVSAGGNLVNGTDIDFFNILDGMWPQLIAIATADTNRRVTIAKNSGVSYTAQRFDATDTTNKVAEGIFESLLYNSDFRLRDQQNLVFLCTQSIFDQYAKELRSRNIDASFTRIESGYNTLSFEGIQIIAVSAWDTNIQTYYKNGTKYYLPHRAVLTTKDNIPVGVEDEKSMGTLDPFYDKKSKTFNVDFGMNLDMKVLEGYLTQSAY